MLNVKICNKYSYQIDTTGNITFKYYWNGFEYIPVEYPTYTIPLYPSCKRYEYKCPHCGHVNVRYEECGRVVCDHCKKEFIPEYCW